MNVSLQQLAQALGGEISNGQVLAPGPQHSPKDRSLAVKLSSTAPDGFVVFSFAGDDDIECRDYVRAMIGAPAFKPARKANGKAGGDATVAAKDYRRSPEMEAMLATNAAAIAQRQRDQPPRGRVTRIYDYTDSTGALVFQVLRYEPKSFSQRRPDPDHPGGWINNLQGIDRVPYRLPDVLQFPDATLFVCEGEKDTDNCAALGLCATTAAGSKWTASCIRALTGRDTPFAYGDDRSSARDIVILQHNDEAGNKKAMATAQALYGYARSVRIVLLPGLRAGGGDLTDWLEDTAASPRRDCELLVKLCLQAPPWAPDDPATENVTDAADDGGDGDGEPHPTRVRASTWHWIDPEKIPRRQWLYGTSVIRKFVSATIAPGGAGKSSLVIVEVLEMAAGKPLLLDVARAPLRVWYWNLEDPKDEIERRIAAACGFYHLTASDLVGRLFVDSGRDRPCVIARYNGRRQVVVDEDLFAGLAAEIKRRKIDVLVIDPLKRAHQVDENDNTAVDMVVKAFAGIADEANCAVMLLHHTRKAGGGEITAETSRGAKSLVDGCRSVRVLNGMSKEEAERAGVNDHRRYFRVYPDKLNLAPPPDVSDWFKLESVHLGNGRDGSAGDNVGVATPWQWPDAFANVTVATLLAVQHKINGGQWRAHPQAENWVGKAVAEVLELDLERKPDRATVNTLLKTWIKLGALKRIERLDEHRHEKTFIEVGVWAT
jgi:hypothetical protein